MLYMYRQLYRLFFNQNKKKLALLILAILLMSITQITSIALLMPFIALIFDPAAASKSDVFQLLAQYFPGTQDQIIFAVGLSLLGSIVFANMFIAFCTWLLTNESWKAQTKLSATLLRHYLYLPYENFTRLNTADIQKNILFETSQVATGSLIPALNLISYSILSALIVLFLTFVSPILTAALATTLGASYAIAYWCIKNQLSASGEERIKANTRRYKLVNEAFGSKKEVTIFGLEDKSVDRFLTEALKFSNANITHGVASQLPKYVVEATALCALVISLLMLYASGENIVGALPVASAFALGALRLMPALQRIFQALSTLNFNRKALDSIYSLYTGAAMSHPVEKSEIISLKKEITIEGAFYKYPSAHEHTLKDINLSIAKGQLVAFVGTTGGGKTTLADLIMGLISPSKGHVLIDGERLCSSNVKSWRQNIGFVPQDIFLIDASIASNIAFGEANEASNLAEIERAAKMANAHDFIMALPEGYDTQAGDRGIRLSGGQKQRIGIARALYRNPNLIVMDEATSALDQSTEQVVHEAILKASEGKTVILIAHRLSTIKQCDNIYLMDNGRIVAAGTFDALTANNVDFQKLASVQKN